MAIYGAQKKCIQNSVRATYPDCHVPHEWMAKIARKMAVSKEVWGKIFGTINTREKFVNHRLTLAKHEWARLKANDSLECRNCHSSESMDVTRQSKRADDLHERFLFTGEKTCIDCHKGIAHELPPMGQASREPGFGEEQKSSVESEAGLVQYLKVTTPQE